jgi:tripartite-type tricarboxylate transporter receptor subunit TctC
MKTHPIQRRRITQALLASLVAVGLPSAALAQDAPAKILVGFPAGGSFDTIARVLAEKLKTEFNRPVLVENKSGAGGRIAVETLKAAPNDGSVVMLGPDALRSLYPFTFKKLNYDPIKDLVPVGTVSEFAFAMASGAEPRVDNLAEFVTWAKKNPAQANYGIPARGAPHHFFGMVLGDAIGVKMLDVPFQGSAPMASALMGGHISSSIDVLSSLVESHKSGKLKVLAVSSEQRDPQLPDVPTFAEQGYPSITGMGFNALYAPAGTPANVVLTWNKALAKVLAIPDVKARLQTMGFHPVGRSPEELAARGAQSAKRWEPVIKASGFTAD